MKTLDDGYIVLRALQREDYAPLERVINDGELFKSSYTMIPRPEHLQTYIAQSIQESLLHDAFAFVIEHRSSREVVGFTRVLFKKEFPFCVEIASTFIAKSWQRKHINSRAKCFYWSTFLRLKRCSV